MIMNTLNLVLFECNVGINRKKIIQCVTLHIENKSDNNIDIYNLAINVKF